MPMTNMLAAQKRLLIAFVVSAPILLGVYWLAPNDKQESQARPSPPHRFVIALRSPDVVVETGLPMGPSEKRATNLACGVTPNTLSGPV
jgi:hypothetical protein